MERYNSPFLVGGGGGVVADFTTEGLWLGAYHELVPVDLKALRSSRVLHGLSLISSYPSLSLLFLRNKHSSGKIKNSKQRPLEERITDPRLTDIFTEVGEPSVSQ